MNVTEEKVTRNIERIEFVIVNYLPTAASNNALPIAVIFFSPSDLDLENAVCIMKMAPNWQRKIVRIDKHADIKLLRALITEIDDRLSCKNQRKEMIQRLEDSFSNTIVVSARRRFPLTLNGRNAEFFARNLFGDSIVGSTRSRRCDFLVAESA